MKRIICEIDAASLGDSFSGNNDDLCSFVQWMNEHRTDFSVEYMPHTSTINGGRTFYDVTYEPTQVDDEELFMAALAACQRFFTEREEEDENDESSVL